MDDRKPGTECRKLQEGKAKLGELMGEFVPKIIIVLGSGLGWMVDLLQDSKKCRYVEIPNCPIPAATGHAGELHWGRIAGVPVAMPSGRVHLYEGFSVSEVVFLVRLLAMIGDREAKFILTHAVGATTRNLKPTDIVGIRDHIAINCPDPTAGVREKDLGLEFSPMGYAYSPRQLVLAETRALDLKVAFRLGVSHFKLGRCYETAAEIETMRRAGADVATMSTIPEVMALAQIGREVLDLALVTNMGTGLGDVSHTGVEAVAGSMKTSFGGLIEAIVPPMAEIMVV